jgi:hypothetical protein
MTGAQRNRVYLFKDYIDLFHFKEPTLLWVLSRKNLETPYKEIQYVVELSIISF